ncbi:MAG: hypothetical protein KDK24_05110 [Pseudooceanicola sp.]|nr:hypothetical protein [Pseudooceanicola sp.]
MGSFLFSGEVVKVDADGNCSAVGLTVDTDSAGLTSSLFNSEFVVDGTSLGTTGPVIFHGNTSSTQATVTMTDGRSVTASVVTFSDGTSDYYLFQATSGSAVPASGHIDPNRVVSVVADAVVELPTNQVYNFDRFHLLDASTNIRNGDALVLQGSTPSVHTIFVADDDSRFQFNASGGDTESKLAPTIWSTAARLTPVSLDTQFTGSAGTTATLVTVNYTTATGSGSFRAIEHTLFSTKTYIPENGHIDLSEITGVTSVVATATPVDGHNYSEFGLVLGKIKQSGDADDNDMFGDIGNDQISGRNGNDRLFGDIGNDLLLGGNGNDTLYGGADDDDLQGGNGNDTLLGGIGDDDLDGGAGRDTLKGNEGDDSLEGKKGRDTLRGMDGDDTLLGGTHNDTLFGGRDDDTLDGGVGSDTLYGDQGADTLDGGLGADTLTGGIGADVFVFSADGATDTITDWQDGIDLIDLDVAFGALTITDAGAGVVHITHSGELLIVMDGGGGTLTAADFTAADFL